MASSACVSRVSKIACVIMRSSHRFRQSAASVLVMLVICSAALALDSSQQAMLDTAANAVKSAQADLNAAKRSAGTPDKPAKGSPLRLTQMRLDSAQQRIDQATALLGKLPGDDAAVQEIKKNYDAAVSMAAQLKAIISPKPEGDASSNEDGKTDSKASDKSASKTDAKSDHKSDTQSDSKSESKADSKPDPAPAAKVSRLPYQQEDLLKNASYYLREAQGWSNAVNKVVAQIDDPKTPVVHRTTVVALNTIEQAIGRMNSAKKALTQLPSDHPKVAAVIKQYNTLASELGAAQSRLKAEEAKLDKLANLKYYPNYDQDSALLSELTRRYGNFQETTQQPEKLASTIKEDAQAVKEIQRIAKTYIPLVQQKTEAGEKIEQQFNYFQSQRNKFAAQLTDYKKTLPAAFENDLNEAQKLAALAVANQKPAYFGANSGIEQNFDFAQKKLLVLQAFGDEFAAPYVAKLAAARADIKQKGKSLEQQIINANTLPPDLYKGADRDAIIAIAKDGWSYQQKDANVLMVRIPSEAWERTTKWEWFDGGFYKVDYSRVQAQLIIKRDDKTAVIQPVNVRMNHLKGDKLTGHPMRNGNEEVEPQSILLLEKVK